MKKTLLSLTLLLSITSLFGMEVDADNNNSVVQLYKPAPREEYPEGIGFIPEEEFYKLVQESTMPDEVRDDVEQFLEQYPGIATLCSPKEQTKFRRKRITIPGIPSDEHNESTNNYVFDIRGRTKIKIAGRRNALCSNAAALGWDSGPGLREHMIEPAIECDIPQFQHLSGIGTAELLNQAKSETIVLLETKAFHLPGKPKSVHDGNYIVAQENMGEEYVQFSKLSAEEKNDVLGTINLEELYRVLKFAGLWNPSEENLWIDLGSWKSEGIIKIAYPDGEKPNNEGSGPKAKWGGIAVFGQTLWKARHNIETGHGVIRGILNNYRPGKVVEDWQGLYASDETVKK